MAFLQEKRAAEELEESAAKRAKIDNVCSVLASSEVHLGWGNLRELLVGLAPAALEDGKHRNVLGRVVTEIFQAEEKRLQQQLQAAEAQLNSTAAKGARLQERANEQAELAMAKGKEVEAALQKLADQCGSVPKALVEVGRMGLEALKKEQKKGHSEEWGSHLDKQLAEVSSCVKAFEAADQAQAAALAASKLLVADAEVIVNLGAVAEQRVESVGIVTDNFQPLKAGDEFESKADKKDHISLVLQLCKTINCSRTLRLAVPDALGTPPDERAEFDKFVVQTVDDEIKAYIAALDQQLGKGDLEVPSSSGAGAAVRVMLGKEAKYQRIEKLLKQVRETHAEAVVALTGNQEEVAKEHSRMVVVLEDFGLLKGGLASFPDMKRPLMAIKKPLRNVRTALMGLNADVSLHHQLESIVVKAPGERGEFENKVLDHVEEILQKEMSELDAQCKQGQALQESKDEVDSCNAFEAAEEKLEELRKQRMQTALDVLSLEAERQKLCSDEARAREVHASHGATVAAAPDKKAAATAAMEQVAAARGNLAELCKNPESEQEAGS